MWLIAARKRLPTPLLVWNDRSLEQGDMRLIDGLMSRLGMAPFAVIDGPVLRAFVGIVIWTWTRPAREMDEQANLWKDDEDRER
jgi:hypothetical protein